MSLQVEIEIETVTMSMACVVAKGGAYTAVTPLSTTVPGRVLPFLSAYAEFVG
jgi:hypothetical protein